MNKTFKDRNSESISNFKQRFAALNGVICFLVDYMPRERLDGLMVSSLRRAGLFNESLSQDVILLTNQYQSRGPENATMQLNLGRTRRFRTINLYDYLQGIDRGIGLPADYSGQSLPYISPDWNDEPAQDGVSTLYKNAQGRSVMYIGRYPTGHGIDYINYLRDNRLYRRDIYDIQGFLSRIDLIDPPSGTTISQVYFRPDGTTALAVTTRKDENSGEMVEDSIELMNRQGITFQRFYSHDELVAFWLLSLLRDKNCFYLLISELAQHHMRAFVELNRQRADYANVRVICQPHNVHTADANDPFNSPLGANYRYLADRTMRVDAVVTLTAWQRDDIHKRFGAQSPRLEVIPHALNLPDEEHIQTSEQAATRTDSKMSSLPPDSVIVVGRLVPQKQQSKAIRAFEIIHKKVPEATLHFYGAGPDEKVLKETIASLGLNDHVFFHGFKSDLTEVYSQAACLLLTSLAEAFPLVLLEALSHGCPCVSFDCRYGPSAIIEDGKNGFIVPPDDLHSLAERAIEILKDKKLRSKLSRQALKVTERFSAQRIAGEWAQLFNSLLP